MPRRSQHRENQRRRLPAGPQYVHDPGDRLAFRCKQAGRLARPGGFDEGQTRYKVYQKMSDISVPGPSMLYVLLDEHPDGINAGGFANQMVENEAQARIIDVPASYHNGAAGISFADGHAEIRKWVDPRTRVPSETTATSP